MAILIILDRVHVTVQNLPLQARQLIVESGLTLGDLERYPEVKHKENKFIENICCFLISRIHSENQSVTTQCHVDLTTTCCCYYLEHISFI